MTDDPRLVAEKFSAAVAARDIDAVADVYADDVTVWHSYDNRIQTRDQSLAALRAFFAAANEVRYDGIERQRSDLGFVQRHTLVAVLRDGGTLGPCPVCLVAHVRDGRIAHLFEYIEPRRVID